MGTPPAPPGPTPDPGCTDAQCRRERNKNSFCSTNPASAGRCFAASTSRCRVQNPLRPFCIGKCKGSACPKFRKRICANQNQVNKLLARPNFVFCSELGL